MLDADQAGIAAVRELRLLREWASSDMGKQLVKALEALEISNMHATASVPLEPLAMAERRGALRQVSSLRKALLVESHDMADPRI